MTAELWDVPDETLEQLQPGEEGPATFDGVESADTIEAEPLFVDVAALLTGGLPKPPAPVLLTRLDGRCLFYAGKVNVLFGDPECGKSWIAYAALVEALNKGRRCAIVDVDHNGAAEIVGRLIILGARQRALADPDVFLLAEPDDKDSLMGAIGVLARWRPAVAVVDSLGEVLPMLGLSSNSPDDYSTAHRHVLSALSRTGAAVITIDHMPKSDDARAHGQTGTTAKRRAVNGVTLRVSLVETFAPGRGGAASLTIVKDRPGGVRAHSPIAGRTQPAGRFVMEAQPDGGVRWWVTEPTAADPADIGDAKLAGDVAELDTLDPPPTSQRDVQSRMGWGGSRATAALREWRKLQAPEALPETLPEADS